MFTDDVYILQDILLYEAFNCHSKNREKKSVISYKSWKNNSKSARNVSLLTRGFIRVKIQNKLIFVTFNKILL